MDYIAGMLGKNCWSMLGRAAVVVSIPVVVLACTPSASPLVGVSTTPTTVVQQDSILTAKVATDLARAQRGRGDFDLAERTLRSASAQVKADRSALAEVEAGLVWLLADRSFYGKVDGDAGRKLIEDATKDARESGNRSALATTTDAAAFFEYRDILFNGGSYAKVRSRFQEAFTMYEALGDLSGQAMSLFHVGLTHEQEGKKAEARAAYQKSAAAAERANDPATLSFPVRHLGYLFAEEGNLDEALRHQRRCLFLRIRGGLTLNVPYAYIAVGEAELAKGELGHARTYFNDALELGSEQRSDSAALGAHLALGKVDERENRKDLALRHYQEALTLAEKLKRNTDLKEVCEHLARVYEQLGDRDKAQSYKQRVRDLEQALKSKS